MKAYELLPRLKFLTLSGYENGEYQWIGTPDEWTDVESDEMHYEQYLESQTDRFDYFKDVTQS